MFFLKVKSHGWRGRKARPRVAGRVGGGGCVSGGEGCVEFVSCVTLSSPLSLSRSLALSLALSYVLSLLVASLCHHTLLPPQYVSW